MSRRELARYHDLAASSKTRGEGIGFAGVGIKLGLLVAEAVLTETRRGPVHVASRWHLASRHKAPWQWVAPPGWVGERGTAVGLRLRNPLSPLLDAGYVERCLRAHFEPLFEPAFDAILAERYPSGVAFHVNGRAIERGRSADAGERAALVVRLPRKRKPAAVGFLERVSEPLPEDRQGLAVSTLGKVIRRGWDWTGLSSASPTLVAGLIEAPGLSAALTLNKGDFLRTGRRGITYLALSQGDPGGRAGPAHRVGRGARPRGRGAAAGDAAPRARPRGGAAGPGRRVPGARGARRAPAREASAGSRRAPASGRSTPGEWRAERRRRRASPPARTRPRPSASSDRPPEARRTTRGGAPPAEAAAEGTLPEAAAGARRPTRYGLAVEFEERPQSLELGRLVESTVLVNTAHPAYGRAVASRAEGYHAALTVAMALGAVAVEPAGMQAFVTTFLARWGEAVGRDRRRRQPRPRAASS